jgi:DNA polymerase-3 subunit epsilon
VVRIDPGSRPRLVFDSLVNPDRRMAATELHGITDQDVVDAPRFRDVAGELLRTLADSVVAAHNVYFDLRFLRFELDRLGLFQEVPHVCTMYSRPLLGLTACNLNDACVADRIAYTPVHSSRSDSLAAALLWVRYREAFTERRILTFRDMTLTGKRYKFFASFAFGTLRVCGTAASPGAVLKPRA